MSRDKAKKPSLLLVEDDLVLLQEFAEYLSRDGFDVHGVSGITDAERALTKPFDLMVLDLNLPDGDGAAFCRRIRSYLRLGIVICSGRSERELRLSLLRSGADAFMVKPVDAEELSATLSSVLRRVTTTVPSPMVAPQVPSLWRLDRIQLCLFGPRGVQIALTEAECLLLNVLIEHPDRTAERRYLLERFEKAALPMTGSRLETLISRLRAKVFAACGSRLPLRANYGRGYIFTAYSELS